MKRPGALAPRLGGVCLLALLTVGTAGCAHEVVGVYSRERGILADTDDLGMLLLAAGVRAEQLQGQGELTVAEARRLRGQLGLESMDGNLRRYGPRVAANYLLSEVIVGGAPVARAVLNQRLGRFERLAVLRPDGHLVMTLSGAMVRCVGPVQVQEGIARAGDYALGVFYSSQEGAWREDRSVAPLPNSAYYNGVVVTLEPK